MYFSGNSAYYDEYIRKGGARNGSLHDPPSLLTDRGAYVNFLEVQLERVSAACLSVSGYDDRFNDMQRLIVNLEEKIQLNTQMLGLNQKHSEETRKTSHQEVDGLRSSLMEGMQNIQSDVQGIYVDLAAIRTGLEEVREKQSRYEAERTHREEHLSRQFASMEGELRNLGVFANTLGETVARLKTDLSKTSFQLQELSSRSEKQVNSSSTRLEELIRALREEMQVRMSAAESKSAGDVERLEKRFLAREIEMMSSVRKFKEEADEEYAARAERAASNVSASCLEEIARSRREAAQRMEDLSRRVGQAEERQEVVESAIAGHLDDFADKLQRLSTQSEAMSGAMSRLETVVEDTRNLALGHTRGGGGVGSDLKSRLERMVKARRMKLNTRRTANLSRQKPVISRNRVSASELKFVDRDRISTHKEEVSQREDKEKEERSEQLERLVEAYHRDAEESRKSLENLSEALLLKSKIVSLSSKNTDEINVAVLNRDDSLNSPTKETTENESNVITVDILSAGTSEFKYTTSAIAPTRHPLHIPAEKSLRPGDENSKKVRFDASSFKKREDKRSKRIAKTPWIPPKVLQLFQHNALNVTSFTARDHLHTRCFQSRGLETNLE